jgi:hypothetical protein
VAPGHHCGPAVRAFMCLQWVVLRRPRHRAGLISASGQNRNLPLACYPPHLQRRLDL